MTENLGQSRPHAAVRLGLERTEPELEKNEGGGTRTLDPRIKSPLLYRLSYALIDQQALGACESHGYCSIDRQLCNWVHHLFFTNRLKMAGRSGVGQSLATLGLGCLLSRPTDVPHGPTPRRYRLG